MQPPDSSQPRDQVGFDRLRPADDHPAATTFPPLEDAPPQEPPWVTAARHQARADTLAAAPAAAEAAVTDPESDPESDVETDPTAVYDQSDPDDLAPGSADETDAGEPGDGDAGDSSGDGSGGHGDDGSGGGGGEGGHGDTPEPPGGGADADTAMGLLDHLGELRTVLIHSSLAALLAAVLCWFWSEDLLKILVGPIAEDGVYFTAPNEAFLTRLKLAGVMGLFVVAPFIFFRIYGFVLPGLYSREKRVVTPLLIATTLLFYIGAAFGFLVVIPQVVRFLLSFGTEAMEPLIGVGKYFSFVARLCLAFGLVFELPLLVLLLSSLGIVDPRMLLRTWRFAILIIFSMSALLTPPDVISQVMMAGPVLVLYLGSVLVSLLVVRRKRNED